MQTAAPLLQVDSLFRYPIKGFAGERLGSVRLQPGIGFPMDRAFAVTDGSWTYDPESYTWKQKREFLALTTQPRVATWGVRLDEDAGVIELQAPGVQRLRVPTRDLPHAGEPFIDLLIRHLGLAGRPRPSLVAGRINQFTDLAMLNGGANTQFQSGISLINLASVRELAARTGGPPLDPRRFRANIHCDSAQPWQELAWVGKTLRIGGAMAKVTMATPRCAVPAVNPQTGERDCSIVQALMKHHGHINLGVYLDIMQAGPVAPGDPITVADDSSDDYVKVSIALNRVNYDIFARTSATRESDR